MMMATTAAMIEQFNKNNILILEEQGYCVHVVANFKEGNPISEERIKAFKDWIAAHNGRWYHVDAVRKLAAPRKHYIVYRFICDLMTKFRYEFIHCHTPMGSVIARSAAKKVGIKVVYTAHGFLFYQGGAIKWWLIDLPFEWYYSKWTDVQIVINHEDYDNAQRLLRAKSIKYLPSVGIDYGRIESSQVDRRKKRMELGIPQDDFVIISVGELHARKNQNIILKALEYIDLEGLTYIMVGMGPLYQEYVEYVDRFKLGSKVRILGFRDDVFELYKMSDCMIHPSIREGLGMAPLEAMACGLPLINTYINGMKDYTLDGISGICVKTNSPIDIAKAIDRMRCDESFRKKCGNTNKSIAKRFSYIKSNDVMRSVYREIVER